MSLILVGDNSLVPILRKLTSIELFMNAEFYSQHPLFSFIVEKHSEFHNSLKNLLPWSVSQECLDSGLMTEDLVKKEAFLNCHDKKWSSFLCILSLSSVIGKDIRTYYPDSVEIRHKLMFNSLVHPRIRPKYFQMLFIFYFVMKVLLNQVKVFILTILFL